MHISLSLSLYIYIYIYIYTYITYVHTYIHTYMRPGWGTFLGARTQLLSCSHSAGRVKQHAPSALLPGGEI